MDGVILNLPTSMEKMSSNMESLTSGFNELIGRLDVNKKSTGITSTKFEAVIATEKLTCVTAATAT